MITPLPLKLRVSVVTCKNIKWWAFLGVLIRYFQKSKESHSAIVVHDQNGDVVFESVFPKSRSMPFEEWQKSYKIYKQFFFEIEQDKIIEFYSLMKLNVNVDYSVAQLFANFLDIFKIPYRFIKYLLTGSSKQICTELCSIFLVWHKGHEFKEPLDLVDINDLIAACTITCTHYVESE